MPFDVTAVVSSTYIASVICPVKSDHCIYTSIFEWPKNGLNELITCRMIWFVIVESVGEVNIIVAPNWEIWVEVMVVDLLRDYSI